MTLPIRKLKPWYGGQFGVEGSDSPLGVRDRTDATTWFVDNTHPGCGDFHHGTDPEHPLQTLTAAIVNRVGDARWGNPYDVIVVGGTGYAETVVVTNAFPRYVTILGGCGTVHQPTWGAATAPGVALTLQQMGWTVEGFTFEQGAAGTAILLDGTGSTGAYKTTVRNCRLDGLYGGLYGINFIGAPHRVTVAGCEFIEYQRGDSTSYAMIVTDSSDSNPYQCNVVGNVFRNCENYVGSLNSNHAWNHSIFKDNIFVTSEAGHIPVVLYLDLRGGSVGYNIVTGNYFGGVYTNAGGYYANAATPHTCWVGNITEPTPATVADNGLTIKVP